MYTFIVNPNARTGLGLKIWKELEKTLKIRNIRYQVFLTKYQNHATEIAGKISSETAHCTLIVLGGDGTMNEVINGITNFRSVVLGYIPIGSSNDFARGMGLSKNPFTALEHILTLSHFTYLNVGVLKYGNFTRRFVVSAGLGFDAEVCHLVAVSPLKKFLNRISLGKLSYVGVALQSLFLQTPQRMSVTLDGSKTLSFDKVYFTAFMNQKYEGGGFMFCPKANPCDGYLDLIVVEGLSKLKILCLLPTAFFGKHTRFSGIHTYRCREANIESEICLPVHTDGEPVFSQNKVSVSLEPQKIRFIIS